MFVNALNMCVMNLVQCWDQTCANAVAAINQSGPPGASPAISFELDLSTLPPPRHPEDTARDAAWVRLIGETIEEWKHRGGQI